MDHVKFTAVRSKEVERIRLVELVTDVAQLSGNIDANDVKPCALVALGRAASPTEEVKQGRLHAACHFRF